MKLSAGELYPYGAGRAAARVIDVRAPVEFEQGALAGSVNAPILTDEERHQVGLMYKEKGQRATIALGYRLTGATMPERVARWQSLAGEAPSVIACWRGGLRSELACRFVGDPKLARLEGGYKAVRQHLLRALPTAVAETPMLVIAGLTGSGKTALLRALAGALQPTPVNAPTLDLEAIANHRGSAFGGWLGAQPSQATFENTLAAALVLGAKTRLILEDESRFIGARHLPVALFEAMHKSPVVMVEESLKDRVAAIFQEYVVKESERHGLEAAKRRLENGLTKLAKRLGGEELERLLGVLSLAEADNAWLSLSAHEPWNASLLSRYYDPTYRHALETSGRPVVFRGNREECYLWLVKRLG